ncbi:MAG: helix-turn-helix domain-containing protein, partial [Desulfobacteraceae bacterium]|nr:helix-turn-helix domain-containing protein [Desulfobacteraceae bacterium]
ERRGDILPLASHFLNVHAALNEKSILDLTPELAERLQSYDFPGNVRELQNLIASAVLVENTDRLQLQSVGIPLGQPSGEASDMTLFSLSEMERRHIQNVLDATCGDRARAAEILGINLSTVYRKIKRYGI